MLFGMLLILIPKNAYPLILLMKYNNSNSDVLFSPSLLPLCVFLGVASVISFVFPLIMGFSSLLLKLEHIFPTNSSEFVIAVGHIRSSL